MPPTPNQHFIQKADMELADLTTGGGLLNPEQAKQFMVLLIQQSKLLQIVTTKTMTGPTFEIPKIGFVGEVLRPAVESQALSEADRVKPDTSKVVLSTKEFIAEARIPYSVVEDNIEQGTFVPLAMELLSKAVSRDMEKVVIRGDTTSLSPLLAQLDGVLKQATSHVLNAGGVRLSKSVLEAMARTMPSEFFDNVERLAILTSKNAAIDYVASVADRPTALGDSMLVKLSSGTFMGMGVIPVPLFPENLGVGGNKTNALMCEPKNITVGIQRQVRIETAKDISARQFIIVATLRFDVRWAHEPALVKATEILAAA